MLEIFLHFQNVGNIATFLKCRNNSAFDNCKNTFETAGNIPAFSFFFSFLIYFGGCFIIIIIIIVVVVAIVLLFYFFTALYLIKAIMNIDLLIS